MKDVQREVQVLKLVGKHDNVAELIQVYEDSAYVHLVLELCEGGELFDRVVAKGTFSEKMAAGLHRLSDLSSLKASLKAFPHQNRKNCKYTIPTGVYTMHFDIMTFSHCKNVQGKPLTSCKMHQKSSSFFRQITLHHATVDDSWIKAT